ncbi:50S ribosomal protein L11 methyltransferase [Candidatus Woesearchaeota archaeon]|nr:50S ribosomal protein L11 methyltransferase [Candidatus Woesearchaeota archaeon]
MKRSPAQKVLFSSTRRYLIEDSTKDFHTSEGFVATKDLQKAGNVQTNTGKQFIVLPALFTDQIDRLHRHAQVITRKDIGLIIAETGIGAKDLVIDAGAGSGMLCCFLARYAKKVITYDVDDRSIEATKKNVEKLRLKNIIIKKKDAYTGFDEKNADLITLDLPSPWNALASAKASLKLGGFLVSYNPHIIQNQRMVGEAEQSGFTHLKTVECILREWAISEQQCRPNFDALGHTGFLSFFRKIR